MDRCLNEANQISFQCKKHTSLKPMLFSLDSGSNDDDQFLCSSCFNSQKTNSENYVAIDDLLCSNEKTIIPKWPPLKNQDLLFEIYSQLGAKKKQVHDYNNLVTIYFDSLKQELNSHIDDAKKAMLIKCNQLSELETQILESYNKIAEKDKIKEVFIISNNSYNQASVKLKKILKQKEEQKEKNQETISHTYLTFINRSKQFDTKSPNIIKEGMIKLIESINFFPDLKNNQEDQNSLNSNQIIIEIMKMIENKTNHCSQQFANEVKQVFQESSFIFERLTKTQVYNEEYTQPFDFKEISEVELIKLEKLCENMKKKSEEIEPTPQAKFLSQLINSPSNYLIKEFQENVYSTLKKLAPLLEHIELTNCNKQNKIPINFDQLNSEQVELVESIVNKMIEKGYSKTQLNPIQQNLPNTHLILSYLENYILNTEELTLLLQHYPVFELLKIDQFTFQKGKFGSSYHNLERHQINNEIIKFTKINTKYFDNNILSNKLTSNKTYKIQFDLNFTDQNNYHFIVGLTSKGENQYFGQEQLCSYIYSEGIDSGRGMDKVKRGVLDNFQNYKQFELTVNLSKGILQVADFPEYNNIAELDDDQKQQIMSNETSYQIGFTIFNQQDQVIIKSIYIFNN